MNNFALIEAACGGFFFSIDGNYHGWFKSTEEIFNHIHQWNLHLQYNTIQWK